MEVEASPFIIDQPDSQLKTEFDLTGLPLSSFRNCMIIVSQFMPEIENKSYKVHKLWKESLPCRFY